MGQVCYTACRKTSRRIAECPAPTNHTALLAIIAPGRDAGYTSEKEVRVRDQGETERTRSGAQRELPTSQRM